MRTRESCTSQCGLATTSIYSNGVSNRRPTSLPAGFPNWTTMRPRSSTVAAHHGKSRDFGLAHRRRRPFSIVRCSSRTFLSNWAAANASTSTPRPPRCASTHNRQQAAARPRRTADSAADTANALDRVGKQHDRALQPARPPEIDGDAHRERARMMPPAPRDVDRVTWLQLRDERLDAAQLRKTAEIGAFDIDAAAVWKAAK